MSSDQVARLAATIEVLAGAVNFLVSERVAARPEAARGDLLRSLQCALSRPAAAGGACSTIDSGPWMPVVAAEMMDAVRRQVGLEPEGILPGRGGAERAGLAPPSPAGHSEVAERAGVEHARAAVAHFERGRAVA